MARASVRAVVGDLRDASRAYAGPRQAGRRTRAAGAPAPACGAAPDRARLGDPSAARARRVGGDRRGARPADSTRRSSSTATVASNASHSLRTGRSQRSPRRCWLPCETSVARSRSIRQPQETTWTTPLDEDEEHATYEPAPGRRVFRCRDAGGARPRGAPRAVPRPLDPGQRLVGLVRPRGEPLLGPAGRAAGGRLHHAQRRGRRADRDRMVARRCPLPEGGLLRVRVPAAGGLRRRDAVAAGGAVGGRARRVHPRLGRRPGQPGARASTRSSSPAPRSGTHARCAAGTPTCRSEALPGDSAALVAVEPEASVACTEDFARAD